MVLDNYASPTTTVVVDHDVEQKNAGDIKLSTLLKIARNPVVDQIADRTVFFYRV